jgi:uncharacterized membrane protein YgcG
MQLFKGITRRFFSLALILSLCAAASFAQRASGTISGQIVDEFGGLLIGATVTVTDSTGVAKTATTNNDGNYVIAGLAPGKYTVRASATGFADYENADVELAAGQRVPLNIKLSVAIAKQEVTVNPDAPINTDPENNQSATILRGADLDALPDDPDELATALQALAGPSAGPNGGQFYIDGFSDGRLPPKESIREIRINANPFSAEYDRIGFGRIEIFTKPGTDKLRGQAFFNFGDESLDSRNPFLLQATRAPYQNRRFGGNLSGPIIKKKASFFLDFERRSIDTNQVVNATILDPSFNIVPYSTAILTPTSRTTFSPRVDYQINQSNTFVARYTYAQTSNLGGVNEFSLPSRLYNASSREHTVQLTETAVINPKTINETRFQFIHRRSNQFGDNSVPAVNVLDAFNGGGAQIGQAFTNEDRYELQNFTTLALGVHSLKFGARFRGVRIKNNAPNNFGGTFTFSSLDQYRAVLLGVPGARPTQFTISGGNPLASVAQRELDPFIQDDWKVRPNLTLNLGLRYEVQSNIHSPLNFAPRLGFAYSPGGGNPNARPKTTIRGGAGIFYERFGENLVLRADRFNGVNTLQYIVRNPDFFSVIPTLDQIAQLSQNAATTVRIAPNLEAPYTIQGAISVDRQLPHNTVVSVTYLAARTVHELRSRNINAPLPGTGVIVGPGGPVGGVRPFGNIGNIYQYESSGVINHNQLIVNFNTRFNPRVTLFGNYRLNKSNGNTDNAGTFPANQYDLSGEYGPTAFDIRHFFFLGGSFQAPYGFTLNPFVIARSGAPFNITIGRDLNGDSLFTDRPGIATDPNRPGLVAYNGLLLDPNPIPGEQILPRNFGRGPSYFSVNMRLSKTFGFGEVNGGTAQAGNSGGEGGGGGGRRGGGGGFGRGGGPFGGGGGGGGFGNRTEKRYNLTLSLIANNIFNKTNLATPSGTLISPLFNRPNALATFGGGGPDVCPDNRCIQAQIRFSF